MVQSKLFEKNSLINEQLYGKQEKDENEQVNIY